MDNPTVFLVSIVRALVEVALLSLLGQGLVGLLSGPRRNVNPIYQLFTIVTQPAIRLARLVSPRIIMERHLPYVAFFLLFWLWIFLAYLKRVL